MDEMFFERRGAIALLTINRPEQRNAMTWEMYGRLLELCDVVDEDERIRVWVLRGAGNRAFVAGTDISQFPSFASDPDAGVAYEANIDRVAGRLAAVEKATIALIQGFALGGGMMLALHCDLRLATPDSKLAIPCVKLGNCLSMANYARLIELVGPARTLHLMYTGRLIDAAEARELGLLNCVFNTHEIEDKTMELATTIAKGPPLTIWATKQAVRRLTKRSLPDGRDLIQTCYRSQDFKEGVDAFLNKRTPIWTGS